MPQALGSSGAHIGVGIALLRATVTLAELVDFDLINSGEIRLSLGAVNVRQGVSIYFDTDSTIINADHVRASGALPPGFPPVTIDGESYWDGGVVSNTPLSYVADQRPMTTARIFQVDTFNARGEAPRTLGQAMERAKDIQYASKSRFNVEQLRFHLAFARDNGATQEELVEAITHLAFYAGWPKAMSAMTMAKEVFGPSGGDDR